MRYTTVLHCAFDCGDNPGSDWTLTLLEGPTKGLRIFFKEARCDLALISEFLLHLYPTDSLHAETHVATSILSTAETAWT